LRSRERAYPGAASVAGSQTLCSTARRWSGLSFSRWADIVRANRFGWRHYGEEPCSIFVRNRHDVDEFLRSLVERASGERPVALFSGSGSGALPAGTDGDTIVNLWRLATRAYHFAKSGDDKVRCQSEAAEQLVRMAELQPMAMLASSMLTEATAELHGVPGKKDRRKELRHRLVDIQAGIADEISSFSHTTDLGDIIKQVQEQMRRPSLRDKFFVFAALGQSPDPSQLAEEAAKSIREHPFASLIAATHHDREGKLVHPVRRIPGSKPRTSLGGSY
jgi:hypothetical protein